MQSSCMYVISHTSTTWSVLTLFYICSFIFYTAFFLIFIFLIPAGLFTVNIVNIANIQILIPPIQVLFIIPVCVCDK